MQLIADRIDVPLEYLKFALGYPVRVQCKDNSHVSGKLCVR